MHYCPEFAGHSQRPTRCSPLKDNPEWVDSAADGTSSRHANALRSHVSMWEMTLTVRWRMQPVHWGRTVAHDSFPTTVPSRSVWTGELAPSKWPNAAGAAQRISANLYELQPADKQQLTREHLPG